MAEVLLYTGVGRKDDPRLEAQTWQRGDVVSVQEDGWAWSKEERTMAGFVIVHVKGISVATLRPLTEPDFYLIPDSENPGHLKENPVWRLRRNRIDLGVLQRLRNDPPAWIALLEEGGEPAAREAGLIIPAGVPPPPRPVKRGR